MASKQNVFNRQFPYFNTFDHEGPVVINDMRNLTVGVLDHLEIIFPTEVYKMLAYTKRILRGSVLKKHREVLVT